MRMLPGAGLCPCPPVTTLQISYWCEKHIHFSLRKKWISFYLAYARERLVGTPTLEEGCDRRDAGHGHAQNPWPVSPPTTRNYPNAFLMPLSLLFHHQHRPVSQINTDLLITIRWVSDRIVHPSKSTKLNVV